MTKNCMNCTYSQLHKNNKENEQWWYCSLGGITAKDCINNNYKFYDNLFVEFLNYYATTIMKK